MDDLGKMLKDLQVSRRFTDEDYAEMAADFEANPPTAEELRRKRIVNRVPFLKPRRVCAHMITQASLQVAAGLLTVDEAYEFLGITPRGRGQFEVPTSVVSDLPRGRSRPRR